MKAPTVLSTAAAAIGLSIAVGASAYAGTTATTVVPVKKAAAAKRGAAAAAVPASGTQEAASLLDQAYGLLRAADHDYKGHRAHAMHLIETAARELGVRLSGDGRAGEVQATSDSQLRNAQSLLEQALGGLAGKPHNQVAKAITSLSTALAVR